MQNFISLWYTVRVLLAVSTNFTVNPRNCSLYLCFVYKICHRVQRIEFWGFLVDFMLLKRKNRIYCKFDNSEIFIFCTFLRKCLVDVRQSWSLFIEFRGFHFSPPSGFNAIYTCFQYTISCFAKAYCNNFASNFWQVAVCGVQLSKSFTGYHILLLELISFQKLQSPKHRQRQIVNAFNAHTETS